MSCISVSLLGTGSASHPRRAQSSILIDTGNERFLIDAGCSSWKTLISLGYELKDIDWIIVTHAHIDHVCSLSHIMFLLGFKAPSKLMTIYTPGGTHRMIVERLLEAGSMLSGSRFKVVEVRGGETVKIGSVLIRSVPAVHVEGALSYVVTAGKGESVIVVSGDTAPNPLLAKEAARAHLVVHEATMPWGRGEYAIKAGHTSVDQAIAFPSGAEELILYHLSIDSEASLASIPLHELESRSRYRRIEIPIDGYTKKMC